MAHSCMSCPKGAVHDPLLDSRHMLLLEGRDPVANARYKKLQRDSILPGTCRLPISSPNQCVRVVSKVCGLTVA